MTILLDLTKLTQEQLDTAMANPGSCSYRAPCILGAMMTEGERATVRDEAPINRLIREGHVCFPSATQRKDARWIQNHFDMLDVAPERVAKLRTLLLRHNPDLRVELPS